jgi:hypothetical protein
MQKLMNAAVCLRRRRQDHSALVETLEALAGG